MIDTNALAERLRSYIRGRRENILPALLQGQMANMESYHAVCGRLDELDGVADAISDIMKDINGG